MPEDPLIGYQLANYRIERALGRGGMAQVYYGMDVKLARPVAIKLIDARYRDNPAYAERFVREARTVATWRHENIIQIYYADDQDGLYFFAMEYIDGADLGEILSQYATRGQIMPHAEVLRIGRAIAAALDYAHQRGVVHRDVKPRNVMVATDGRVVLTDFGLALDVDEGSRGEVFGSSHYIAPEQARRSANAVPQSDLYSLGVILYEILTGKLPFDDPSPTAVALQHITQPPPRPSLFNPKLSTQLETVLLKTLSKKPEGRYQSGAALMDALEVALRQDTSEPQTFAALGGQITAGSERESLIGQQLDEYRLETLLGRGGMARVYLGYDARLKRKVAVKVIDTPFRTDSAYMKRFEREAQAIAQLDHPNIVRLYRYGETRGVLYMAMQYIEGTSLDERIAHYHARGELMPAEELNRIIQDVCRALDYAHTQGVIHRDIKPANIVLNANGAAVLTDFGLALLTEEGTQGEVFGTPHYIAPEQAISSAGAVPQSDLYAVGVILYELFTGELPFDAAEPLDVAMLHMSEPPRPPRELRPQLNAEVEAVILKTLAKEPTDRYATGAALAAALSQALQNKSVAKRAAAPPPPKKVDAPSKPAYSLPIAPAEVAVAKSSGTPSKSADMAALAALPKSAPPQKKQRSALPYLVGIIALVAIIAGLVWMLNRGDGDEMPLTQPSATSRVAASVAKEEPTTSAVAIATSPPATAMPSATASPSTTATTTITPSPTVTASPLPRGVFIVKNYLGHDVITVGGSGTDAKSRPLTMPEKQILAKGMGIWQLLPGNYEWSANTGSPQCGGCALNGKVEIRAGVTTTLGLYIEDRKLKGGIEQ